MVGSRVCALLQPPGQQTHNGCQLAGLDMGNRIALTAATTDRPLCPMELLPVAILTLVIIASLAYASLRPRQVAGEILGVATIGGPPTAAIAAVSAAGGEILRDGNFANSVIARAPDVGFVERLHAAGVHLVYRIDRNSNCAAITEAADRNVEVPPQSDRFRPSPTTEVAGGG